MQRIYEHAASSSLWTFAFKSSDLELYQKPLIFKRLSVTLQKESELISGVLQVVKKCS